MAEFVYNPGRMSMLLRLAPWVDLEAAREEILNRLKDAGFSRETLDRIESYEKGEVATLPSSYSIQDEVVYAISDLYRRQMDHDRSFMVALKSSNNTSCLLGTGGR